MLGKGSVSYSIQRTFKLLQVRGMALDQHSGKVHYPRQDEVRALQAPSAYAQRDTSSNNLQAQLPGTCYIREGGASRNSLFISTS